MFNVLVYEYTRVYIYSKSGGLAECSTPQGYWYGMLEPSGNHAYRGKSMFPPSSILHPQQFQTHS